MAGTAFVFALLHNDWAPLPKNHSSHSYHWCIFATFRKNDDPGYSLILQRRPIQICCKLVLFLKTKILIPAALRT